MLNIKIPTTKFNTTDYPNLEERADGLVIPELWGIKTKIVPICIDTTTGKFKISKRKLKAIDEIRGDGTALSSGVDYTEDLANGEFTLKTTPKLSASTTYYIVIEGDFTINASNYVTVNGDDDAGYSDGQAFEIDGGDNWTGKTADFRFRIYGKNSIDGMEELKVEFNSYTTYFAGELRKAAATTKLGQSFLTPSDSDFYVTRIVLFCRKMGSLSGNIWVSIHSDQVGTQVGLKSTEYNCSKLRDSTKQTQVHLRFPQRGSPTELEVDAQGYYTDSTLMENVANILEDIITNVIGAPSSILDSSAFSDIESARTQDLAIHLDSEMKFGVFVEKLEQGQLFKFLPQLDGTYAPIYYQSGEPAGTPHLRDEDFISFKCFRNVESVKQKYIIKYNRDPFSGTYQEEEEASSVAEYIYKNREVLEVETYLKDSADASQLASDYKDLLEYPQREIEFEVKSYLLNKITTDKVKITRSRGDNSGGSFDAVLFRILKLTKKQATGTVICRAVLDSQTY